MIQVQYNFGRNTSIFDRVMTPFFDLFFCPKVCGTEYSRRRQKLVIIDVKEGVVTF